MRTLLLGLAFVTACATDPVPRAPAPPPTPPAPKAAMNPPPPPREEGPPRAIVREVKDAYFGVTVADPYRWMEEPNSPELATYMKAQAGFTRAKLDARPERAALAERIKALDHTGARVWGVESWGGRYFYFKRDEGHELAKFCVRDGLAGAERVLVDPESMTKDNKHVALDWAHPSVDGKLVAYGISPSGSEDSVLYVVDAGTGKLLADTIDRMQFDSVSWLDDKRFFYTRQQKVLPDAPQTEKYKRATAYLHTLGADPDKDPPVIGVGVNAGVPVKDTEIGIAIAPAGSRWAFAIPADGVRKEITLYAAPRTELGGPKTPWKKLVDVKDDVTNFDVHGDDLYVLSHKDAPRFRVLKMSISHPDLAKAKVLVPEGDVVVNSIGAAKDALYLGVLDAGIGRLRRLAYDGAAAPENVPLPVDGALDTLFTTAQKPGATFRLVSWTTSTHFYGYEPKAKKVEDTKLAPPSPVDFSGVVAEETRVPSTGGVMVPLSIVHAKEFAKDGSHPTWLDGYGSYGITIDPEFKPTFLAWYERGGIWAVCHVRGGGELGEGWHKDGMLANKQHSIDDFLACAQWLVDNKYTSSAKLAGEGTSAGGLVIGGAITQRPELFGAALIRVGVSNPLRFEHTVNVLNVPEFGTSTTEDGFKALLAMDAYSHVKDGTKYPAVLLTTGATDPRVAPWQVTKMAARLQAATASAKPVLLRVDYDAGHGMGSTAAQRDEELADELAFLLWNLGDR
jgi:prolyl oligopeptidase